MRPWDAGLQPERTELAWRRTVLATTTGTVLAARYLGASNLMLGLTLPLLAVLGGLVLLYAGSVRFRRLNEDLRAVGESAEEPVMPGGAMLAALSGMCVVIALASAAFIVATAVARA
ncbi:hypothetical protein GCM10023169_31010 [Georgenia halophila]|uniref:DUF202 domain-containing protein n=1 Tax=Georgenia halophila TaxID=620889 RepID=A0ABP8LHL4_9MICO